MVVILLFLIQMSLLLFFLGLALFLYQIAPLLCGIITSILAVGLLCYQYPDIHPTHLFPIPFASLELPVLNTGGSSQFYVPIPLNFF